MNEEKFAPPQQAQGAQRFLAQMDCTCAAQNSSAPETALFGETPQGIARRGI
ncbi:hypothetical protein HMPREF1992_01963 [Selenomonas sp. oral taxon 892 str. F0426]|uniref:hypothetical protein n=1 Tax=Selenomonas sp. oral taxon 892 TaxID=1321785 RepID=UPI0003AD3285|nr:hypothetical protein [Selenomonas sp. oral taxon 892]ERJ89887.1 hypothetical protein HMPREF1992_01963 [Selenomonas sp. oral taxon 892 str. F0426]